MFPRRLEILKFLAGEAGEGRSPTIPEIADAVGVSSTQTVHHHLKALEEEGYVTRSAGKARSAVLTEKGLDAAGGGIPTLGRIAAGPGIEAVRTEEASTVARELFGAGRFLLEASGQSMTGAGIEDGDQLLVVADPSPPDGTIVAALLQGERVTVKRLYREGNVIRLRAENGEHRDIVAPAEDVEVQGRVELILRRPWRGQGRSRR
ncbi:repressor LexA (plasmid) [Rubrobacter tropicus]|uniref:Repressor LexA n=1 Tax=Rubrobacter tropicus TaxID=2653851 RepID=A0A6G8QGA8_9ACTN|nr:transcriptional repressor LexA [Rubrobacter tropicus]QIN85441.1 repressor LexA [Rubrobacter tropicus]